VRFPSPSTDLSQRAAISCSAVLASSCVRHLNAITDTTADFAPAGAITVFATVSSEFVYRFCKGKPLHAIAPEAAPGALSSSRAELEAKGAYSPVVLLQSDGEPSTTGKLAEPAAAPGSEPMAGGGFIGIPKKLRLALVGLALSTALIFIRWVRACRLALARLR
jgi:hypothetical protein